jgi:hypothetical protein
MKNQIKTLLFSCLFISPDFVKKTVNNYPKTVDYYRMDVDVYRKAIDKYV